MRPGMGSIGQGISGAVMGAGRLPMSGEQIEEARAIKVRLRCSWSHLSQITGRNAETLKAALAGPVIHALPASIEAAMIEPPFVRMKASPTPDPFRGAKRIMANVAARHGLSVGDLVAWDRRPALVIARHEALTAVRALTGPDGAPRYSFASLVPLFKRHEMVLRRAMRLGCGVAAPPDLSRAREAMAVVARNHGMTVEQMIAPGHGTHSQADARREALRRIRFQLTAAGEPIYSWQSLEPLFGRSGSMLAQIARRRGRLTDRQAPPWPNRPRPRTRPVSAEVQLARGQALLPVVARLLARGWPTVRSCLAATTAGVALPTVDRALKGLAKLDAPLVAWVEGRDAGWVLTPAGSAWLTANNGAAAGVVAP